MVSIQCMYFMYEQYNMIVFNWILLICHTTTPYVDIIFYRTGTRMRKCLCCHSTENEHQFLVIDLLNQSWLGGTSGQIFSQRSFCKWQHRGFEQSPFWCDAHRNVSLREVSFVGWHSLLVGATIESLWLIVAFLLLYCSALVGATILWLTAFWSLPIHPSLYHCACSCLTQIVTELPCQ